MESKAKICKLCGAEKKNMDMHLKFCLKNHEMTREQYDMLEEYKEPNSTAHELEEMELPETEEVKVVSDKITIDERIDNIYKGTRVESRVENTLGSFLEEFELTEEELMDIVRTYKSGSPQKVTQIIKINQELGAKGAVALKDQTDVETYDLNVAEALVKNHGFVCLRVAPPEGKHHKKRWILKKK